MEKKNWETTTVAISGTMMTDEEGKIAFNGPNQFKKYTATLRIAANTPWDKLARKSTFVFVDGLRQMDVEALRELEENGEIDKTTRFVVIGHLVRTPGKPGMNDIFNLKTMFIRAAAEGENVVVDFENALTKNEWKAVYNEKYNGIAKHSETSAAPVAPVAPAIPF